MTFDPTIKHIWNESQREAQRESQARGYSYYWSNSGHDHCQGLRFNGRTCGKQISKNRYYCGRCIEEIDIRSVVICPYNVTEGYE